MKFHTTERLRFFISCILHLKVKALVAQLCGTLCNPMDCSPPGFSVHGILQARILEWVSILFARGSSHSGINPWSLSLQADSLPRESPGKNYVKHIQI